MDECLISDGATLQETISNNRNDPVKIKDFKSQMKSGKKPDLQTNRSMMMKIKKKTYLGHGG